MIEKLAEYRKIYRKSAIAPCVLNGRSFPVSDYLNFKKMLSESADHTYSDDRCLNSPFDLKKILIEKEHDKICYTEALIKTYPTDAVIKSFKRWFRENVDADLQHLKFSDIVKPHYATKEIDKSLNIEFSDVADIQQYAEENQNGNCDIVTFYIPYFKSRIEKTDEMTRGLCDTLYRCGYNIASSEKIFFDSEYTLRDDVGVFYVTFEPKFTEQRFEFSDFLYHVTPINALHKINRRGLTPLSRHSFFQYPDRVYLFNNCIMLQILDYGISKSEHDGQNQMALLRIKSENLTNDEKYKNGVNRFYVDRKYPVIDGTEPIAIYTYNNIDRKLIDDKIVIFDIDNGVVTNKKDDSLLNF